ncbi:hypothetical protein IM660_05900 [Ruania alkalisoli]|uniref:Carbohydrate-binding domain-containing protein n=1 Tax=Ruania alkalisoli TaxID=2779775 RepID=A0A7M1SW71_9MICO|nr:sugar-binding protein [Ruania alkalisoli]QOR71798.1 hypothetical protein IM660_05900 [Ruania alkalisoli]
METMPYRHPRAAAHPRPRPSNRHLPAALVLVLALGLALLAPAPPATADENPVVVGDFEALQGWSQSQSHGAVGSMAPVLTDAVAGSGALQIDADLAAGGWVTTTRADLALDATALTFGLRSEHLEHIIVRGKDSTGQWHQQSIATGAGATWQEISVTDFTSGDGYLHFGGANDGVWHGALTAVAVIVENSGVLDATTAAVVQIDAVTVTTADGEVVVGDFEGLDAWTASPSQGAEGAITPAVTDAPSGTMGLRYDVDVSNGGWLTGVRSGLNLDATAVSLAARSEHLTALRFRVQDATGQWHQQRLDLPADNAWHEFEIGSFTSGADYLHFGGANDGAWHAPLTAVSVIVVGTDAIDPSQSVVAWLDAVSVTVNDASPEPIGVPHVLGEFESGSLDQWWGRGSTTAVGSVESVTTDAAAGSGALRVETQISDPYGTYRLSRGGFAVDAERFRAQIRTDDLNAVLIRFKDTSNQWHQQRVSLTADGSWREVVIDDFTAGDSYLHFGGADDGVFHGLLEEVRILVLGYQILDRDHPASFELDAAALEVTLPDIAIEPTTLGNVFTTGDIVAFDYVSEAEDIAWIVRDFGGNVVDTGSGTAAALQGTITLDLDEPGWYDVELTGTTGDGSTVENRTTVGILDPWVGQRSDQYGIATHFSAGWDTEIAPLITTAGYGMVRDSVLWVDSEVQPGVIEWPGVVESYAPVLEQQGTDLQMILGFGNGNYESALPPTTPEGIAAFAEYSAQAVRDFGVDRVTFEVWNEWNGGFGRPGPADSRADTYFALLEATYTAIKAENPDAVVIGAATVHVPLDWFDDLFALGALNYMDEVSIHPYVYPRGPEDAMGSIAALRDLMDSYGPVLPLNISEQGWPTGDAGNAVTPEIQASVTVRAQALAAAADIDHHVIYNLMEKGNDASDVEDGFGLVEFVGAPEGSYVPKPAYVASAVYMRQVNGLEQTGHEKLGTNTNVVTFDAGSGADRTQVVWSLTPRTIAVAASGPVTVTTMMGREQVLTPDASGEVTLSVTRDPVYLSGDTGAVTLSDAHTLTFEQGFIGSPTAGEWVVDNTDGAAPTQVDLVIEGTTYSASVPAGDSASVPVTAPARDVVGQRDVLATLRVGGQDVGILAAPLDVAEPLGIEGSHAIAEDGLSVLRLSVGNRSTQEASLANVTWQIEGTGESGAFLEGGALTPGERVIEEVDLSALTDGTTWSATVETADGYRISTHGPVYPVGALTHAQSHALTVDGAMDAAVGATPAIELGTDGVPPSTDWTGAEDLGGRLWFTWDEDSLYLTAEIDDDVHHQPAHDDAIWSGDSLQLAVGAGAPGEPNTTGWSELGFALTDTGPEVFRWLAADHNDADLSGIDLAVARDETTATTTYEVALPWEYLAPARSEDGLISVSVVLNENDGAGRAGWYRWGDGIANEKDSTEFRSLWLVPAEEPEPAPPTFQTLHAELDELVSAGSLTTAEQARLTAQLDTAERHASAERWTQAAHALERFISLADTVGADGTTLTAAAGQLRATLADNS